MGRKGIFVAGIIICMGFGLVLQAHSQDKLSIKVAVIRGTQLFPMYVMQNKGFAEKYDLDISRTDYAGPKGMYTALRSKSVDLAFAGWTTVCLFRTQGVNLVNIYSMYGFTNDVLVRTDSPLQDFGDLKGKKIGIFGGPAGSTTALFRIECIQFFGFDPIRTSKITYGAPPLLGGMVGKGELDAALILDPIIVKLLDGGKYRSVGNIGDIWRKRTGQDPLLVTLATNEDFIKKNRKTLKNFVQAYKESVDYIKTHPKIWDEIGNLVGIKTRSGIDLLKSRTEHKLITWWDEDFIAQQKEYAKKVIKTIGKDFLPYVPDGAFSLEFAPR